MAASSVRFGPGVTREVGMDLVDLGVRRALVVTDPDVARLAPVATVLAPSRRPASRPCSTTGSGSSPPTCPSATRSQFARAAAVRRHRRRRRRVGHRYRQGRQPVHDLSAGRLSRLRQCADRQSHARAGAAQTARCGADNRRDRQRDHRRQHLRPDDAARQDRHREPTAQANARPARSRQHADDAEAGRGVQRARHPEPRPGVVHGYSVLVARAAGASCASSGLPGIESDQRHLGAAGSAHRRSSTSFAPSKIRQTTRRASR